MSITKRRVIRKLLEVIREDLESLIDSNTFPRGDVSTLSDIARPDKERYERLIFLAESVLER